MKYTKIVSIASLLTMSFAAFAGAGHGGGHSHGMEGHDMSNMKMGGAGHWMAPAAAAAIQNPIKSSKASIATGSKLFQQYCAACHGANAEGDGMAGQALNPKPANLRVMSGGHPDGDFAYKIREGRGAMPSWKNILKEEQVWHIVNFVQDLKNNPMSSDKHGDEHEEEGGHGDEHGHEAGGHHG